MVAINIETTDVGGRKKLCGEADDGAPKRKKVMSF
jgi:hypothetical protein